MKNILIIVVGAFLVLTATTSVFGQENAKTRLTPNGNKTLPKSFYGVPVILTPEGKVDGTNGSCDWIGYDVEVTKVVADTTKPVPATTIDNSVNTIATGRSIANGQIFNNGTLIQNTGDFIFNLPPPPAPLATPVVLPQVKGLTFFEVGPFFRVSGKSPVYPQGGQFGVSASMHSYGLTASNQTKQFGLIAGAEFYIAPKYAQLPPDGLIICDTCGVYVPVQNSEKKASTTNISVFAGVEFQGWGPNEDKPIWLSASLVGRYDSNFGSSGLKNLNLKGEVAVKAKLPFEVFGKEPIAYVSTGGSWHPWTEDTNSSFEGGAIVPHLALGVNLVF